MIIGCLTVDSRETNKISVLINFFIFLQTIYYTIDSKDYGNLVIPAFCFHNMIISLYSTESRVEVVLTVEIMDTKKKDVTFVFKTYKKQIQNKPNNNTTSFEKEGKQKQTKDEVYESDFSFHFGDCGYQCFNPNKKECNR